MEANKSRPPSRRIRNVFFSTGDCFFLMLVGSLGTLAMRQMHDWVVNFAGAMLAGMAAAMVIQMSLAFIVAPLLGSIESMTPSMVVAMLSPMSVCVCHMAGFELNGPLASALGLGFGVGMFVFLVIYTEHSTKTLRRFFPGT